MSDVTVQEEQTNNPLIPKALPIISEDDKKKMLQNTIYHLTEAQAFYGQLLQEITIKYSGDIPSAGITFNTKAQQFEVYVNPNFFFELTPKQRIAVFHHEILHFTNKHLFRMPFLDKEVPNEEKKKFNIAGDMAINQYINDLPDGCVNVKDWKLDDGSQFPTLRNMEEYYQLIKDESKKQEESEGEKKAGTGPGTKGNVNEMMDKFKDFDKHYWDSLDEETKKQMLDEAKKILKRTVEKTSYNHSNVPDSIKDLLQEIEGLTASINYKQILKNIIKKTVSSVDREPTWKKPNRRYGVYSPGSKIGSLPNLSIFADTSGSISHKELNEFLIVISGFLKAGSRTCWLGLWHTNLYYKKRYKLNEQLDPSVIQSGGTDLTEALEDVKKTNPNLAIILTDGFYHAVDIKLPCEVIFIISSGGNQNHPMKNVGKTILLDSIKDIK